MNRRDFLLNLGVWGISSSLVGCQNNLQSTLTIKVLKSSLPPQFVGEFKKFISPSPKVEISIEPQLQDLFERLVTWSKPVVPSSSININLPFINKNKPVKPPQLVSLGDYWLESAIEKKLIQPLAIDSLPNWSTLDPIWQKSVTRDGKIWAAPYRWGTTVIIYRADLLKQKNIKPPTDWSDLWRSEFKQKISLLNQSREVIGLTLKKLGYSYNETDLTKVNNLKENLQTLHQQAKFYSDDAYLQPLIMGDTLLAVGWSDDIIDLLNKNPKLKAIVPSSGTAIWADIWVKPINYSTTNNQSDRLGENWINFCWQTKTANQISLFTAGASPILTSLTTQEISPDISKNIVLFPGKEIISRSEFIQPLTEASKQQYQQLWKETITNNQ